MNRFYISPKEFENEEVSITGEDYKHLTKVLRLKPGEKIEVFNSNNLKASGTIKDITEKEAIISLTDKQTADSENQNIQVTLFQGYPKQNKLETIVQKATELGVYSVEPFYSKRSVVKPSKNENRKIQRLQRIAYEAGKQCGRGLIPTVNPPSQLNKLIEKLKNYDLILLAYEEEKDKTLKKILEELKTIKTPLKIALLIGPEGGFDQEEVNFLKENLSVETITLGNRILRTETAGMAVLSQLNFYFEE